LEFSFKISFSIRRSAEGQPLTAPVTVVCHRAQSRDFNYIDNVVPSAIAAIRPPVVLGSAN
jgi:nucleoside-diphosphate-sugar epimerase